MIALDLAAGDHPLVLKLHQRDGGWRFGVRLVDETLRAPDGAWLALPGTRRRRQPPAILAAPRVVGVARPRDRRRRVPREGHRSLPRRGAAGRAAPGSREPLVKVGREDQRVFDIDAGEASLENGNAGELVVALPPLLGDDAAKLEDGDYVYEVDVAGRPLKLPFYARRATRDALAHADRALASLAPLDASPPAWLREGSLDSVRNLRDRLARLIDHGDADFDSQKLEAQELDAAAGALERTTDPYDHAARATTSRRAYHHRRTASVRRILASTSRRLTSLAQRRWPLIVALHGMQRPPSRDAPVGSSGGDAEEGAGLEEDRHWSTPDDDLPTLDAFVVTPGGHGNAMYRDLGEDDVLRVLDWARRTYPIDADHVTITGPSMGASGTAAIAYRHPDLFAAAAPLCGYHSYFVRRDVTGRPMRPWERVLAEERSNVEWAANGENLPLWIVHGTQDLPEANSGVLIDRYEQLGYSVTHDHPNLGHNVWQSTYEGMKGAKWLLSHARVAHPKHVRFRTVRLRDGDDAWVHVSELTAPDAWGEVEGTVTSRTRREAGDEEVKALRLDRDEALLEPTAPLVVAIDGARLVFTESEPVVLHRDASGWAKGGAPHDGLYKHGEVTGPLRDAFHAPLLFVYGADDPSQTRANEEVARAWAQIRWGTTVKYPVLSATRSSTRARRAMANDRALFLVGSAASNRVVRALEADFPIRVEDDAVVVGGLRITGSQVGAAFVRPNPKRPDRYVVVVEGVDALGTWRSLSLPDLLPDFVVCQDEPRSHRRAGRSCSDRGCYGREVSSRTTGRSRRAATTRSPPDRAPARSPSTTRRRTCRDEALP